jgi:uncharacterized membrane protein YeaQ/YmgE (transglycosylase-associated protein family)
MHLIWSLLVGLVVGAIAKAIMPGRDPGGLLGYRAIVGRRAV